MPAPTVIVGVQTTIKEINASEYIAIENWKLFLAFSQPANVFPQNDIIVIEGRSYIISSIGGSNAAPK